LSYNKGVENENSPGSPTGKQFHFSADLIRKNCDQCNLHKQKVLKIALLAERCAMKSGLQKLVVVCLAIVIDSCQLKTNQQQHVGPHPVQILSGTDTVLSPERNSFSILKSKSGYENKKIFMVFSFLACSL
jgi:hypothetical protein